MQLRLYYPVKPLHINQMFGNPDPKYMALGLKGHNGIDLMAYHGQEIYATHDGIVTFAGEDGAGGYGIVLRTNGIYDYNSTQVYFKSIYWHLLPGSFKVTAGQQVKTGDVIAKADNTGMSTGDHLHFGLKPVFQGEKDWQWYNAEQDNGYKGAIDPSFYWTDIYAQDYGQNISLYTSLILILKSMVGLLSVKNK